MAQLRNLRSRAIVCSLLACLLLVPAKATSETARDVFAKWKNRDLKIRAAFVVWKEKVLKPKGTLDAWQSQAQGPFPKEDFSYEVKASLKLQGDLVRYERDGLEWFSNHAQFLATRYLNVFDGGPSSKAFWEHSVAVRPECPEGKLRIGVEMEGRSIVNFSGLQLHALILALCATDPRVGLKEADWQLGNEIAIVDGNACLVLRKRGPGPYEESYFIDRDRAYSVVRNLTYFNGQPHAQLDISYRKDPKLDWIPSAWQYTHYVSTIHGRRLDEIVSADVTSYQLNSEISEQDFKFDFPPGTHVSVHPHRGKNKDVETYVVTKAGRTDVSSSDPRWRNLSTYESVIKAAMEPPRHGGHFFYYVAAICAIVLAVGVWVYRLRKRARARLRS